LPVVAITCPFLEVALLAQVINYIDILPISIITWGVLRMISGTESYLLEYKDSTDNDISYLSQQYQQYV
jgi:hypothetical protein